MPSRADQVVFLVHGMGSYPEHWEDTWVKALKLAYDQYPLLNRRSFEARFEIVPITYGDIFAKEVQAWQDNATALAKAGVTGLGKNLTSWLKNAGELKSNFLWTHAADVLLYRLLALVHDDACEFVATSIADKIRDSGPGTQWSVIAHSLGTSVVHDALSRLDVSDSVFLRDYPARLIAMVANVSRVLEQKTNLPPGVEGDVYVSPVQPGKACQYFLNLEHQWDPFTWPSRFHPTAWPSQAILSADPPRYIHSGDHDIDGRSWVLDHIHDKNTHAFEHYIASPKAHIPLFRMLTEEGLVPPPDEQRARDRFPQFGTIGSEAAIAIKSAVEDLRNGKITDAWDCLGKIWDAMSALKDPT